MNRQGNANKIGLRLELLIYAIIWVLVFLFPVIHESVGLARGDAFLWKGIYRWWYGMIPFFAVFLFHNFILIPKLLLEGRLKRYFLCVALLMAVFIGYEYMAYAQAPPHKEFHRYPPKHMMSEQYLGERARSYPLGNSRRPPKPILINALLAFLLLGCNVAVVMLFKYQRDEEDRKMLENMAMREELKYLKSQINPHFFMNMLNNIHSMVDVEPSKAQEMILELSKLMRYVLYEGENKETTLANEVKFIMSYVSLMRRRYPVDKVYIEMNMPESPSEQIMLPPLLFIAFVENAFKHGVSYLRKSFINISLKEENGRIFFFCRNTKPVTGTSGRGCGGVGLDNVRRRLELLYGDKACLDINDNKESYTVNLIIPCH